MTIPILPLLSGRSRRDGDSTGRDQGLRERDVRRRHRERDDAGLLAGGGDSLPRDMAPEGETTGKTMMQEYGTVPPRLGKMTNPVTRAAQPVRPVGRRDAQAKRRSSGLLASAMRPPVAP